MNDSQILLLKLKNDNIMYKRLLDILKNDGVDAFYDHIKNQSGGGLMDELRSKIDRSYVKDIDFSKPGGLSDEDKRYIKTLSAEQKQILRKRAEEKKHDFSRRLSSELRQPARVIVGEELEKIKSTRRDQKAYDEMMKKYMALSGNFNLPQIPSVSNKEYDDLENMFKNFELNKQYLGGGVISDKIMIKTLSKLNNKEIRMLCKLDGNVKGWCKKHGYYL